MPPRPACQAGVASHAEQATAVPLAGQRAWAQQAVPRPRAAAVARPPRAPAALPRPP